jgi:hypothetical protein
MIGKMQRQSTNRIWKTWRVISLFLMLPGFCMFLYGRNIWDNYRRDLPRSADPVAGRIYPLNIHGIIVFQTQQEKTRLEIFDKAGIAIFFGGLAVGAYGERIRKRYTLNNSLVSNQLWLKEHE